MAIRKLTLAEDRAVVALMKSTYSERTGKTWIFPTDASVALERELNGTTEAARERVQKMKEAQTETPEERKARKAGEAKRARWRKSIAAGGAPVAKVEVAPVVEAPVAKPQPVERRTASAPVYKLFSACAVKQHNQCTGAHFDNDGTRVVCTCKHHRQADMFTQVKSVQTGFAFMK